MKIKSYYLFGSIALFLILVNYPAMAQVVQLAESFKDVAVLLFISFTIFLLLLVLLWLVRVARQLRRETMLKRNSLPINSNTAKA